MDFPSAPNLTGGVTYTAVLSTGPDVADVESQAYFIKRGTAGWPACGVRHAENKRYGGVIQIRGTASLGICQARFVRRCGHPRSAINAIDSDTWDALQCEGVYGLINKALRDVVVAGVGQDGWTRVCRKCGSEEYFFIAFEQYPDELTYSLAGAAASELGVSIDLLLEQVGEYWSQFTVQEGYGHLLDLVGKDFDTVISRVDELHARLMVTMPELRPPSFRYNKREDGTIVVQYTSHRPGLSSLVVGLLRGLARHFGQTAVVVQTIHRNESQDYDEFEVKLLDRNETSDDKSH